MPLKVSDGMSAWISDFQKSDAPQFKDKSDKERRDQAIAAYMSAKKENVEEGKKPGLWANIHAKRKRGEKPNPPGHPDRPTAQDFKDASKNEETVDLDELKKSTLGSYVKKASGDMGMHAVDHGKYGDKQKNSLNKAVKRLKGIEKASDRMTKEGVAEGTEQYYAIVHKVNKKPLSTHRDLESAKDEWRGLDQNQRQFYKVVTTKKAPKDWSMKSEGVAEAVKKDEREYGYEGDMAISQLKTIIRHADHMMGMLKEDTDLPEWVQSKITLATDYMQTAHDYMMSEMTEGTQQVDELSQNTLRQYHGKSALDIRKKRDQLNKGTLSTADHKKAQRRVTGINRAANKMEDVDQLDELKKSTLGSYVKQASRAAAAARQNSAGRDDAIKTYVKRTKGIGNAVDRLTKEELDEVTQGKSYTQAQLHKKIQSGNWEATHDIKPGKHVEMRHHTGKRVMVHVKEDVEEGMKPDRKAPGWMLRADPKLKAKVDANKAKQKEFKKLVGTKTESVNGHPTNVKELSTDFLARYKKKAGASAKAADSTGDVKTGNKRFSGIMKATSKQFKNDLKKESTNESVKYKSFFDLNKTPLTESGGPVVYKNGNDHIEKYADDSFAVYKDGKKSKFYSSLSAAKAALAQDKK